MSSRARSVDEFARRMLRFVSPAGKRYASAFRPRASDVIISTYPKAGTTWMQQIVHGLRSGGDMDFDEITAVTPWIELAFDLGWDLDADHATSPRAFKSHWNAAQLPAGCRYVCVLRDPRDTMISFYHFMNGWFLERDSVPADAFARFVVFRDHPAGDYWQHLLSWWRRRHDPEVLLVTFEDLQEGLASEVLRVAQFLDLDRDPATVRVASLQARFEFMKAHEQQFDDHLIAAARNGACGIPEDARSTKVRSGRSADERGLLSSETLALLDRRWLESVQRETGLASYARLRAELWTERTVGSAPRADEPDSR